MPKKAKPEEVVQDEGIEIERGQLPPNINADGSTNPQLIVQARSGYEYIGLQNEEKELVLVVHTSQENQEPTKLPSDAVQILMNMIRATTGGSGLSPEGALRWLSDERVRTNPNYTALSNGAWKLVLDVAGRSGAEHYEIPMNQLFNVMEAMVEAFVPSIEQWPAKSKVRAQKKAARTEVVDFSFI